jgi:carbonic anhydrase/acetyltransferase-like protein (isoleucine patch superfamily)
MHIRKYKDISPQISPDAFLMQGCIVVGDVKIGPQSSVWYGATVRGDVGSVTIGARTNIQENAVIHVSGGGRSPTIIEDDVTVGHSAIVHGAIVRHGCLIGMGAIVLDDAVVGPECLIGAGALVPERMQIPEGSLVIGMPAKIIRQLTEQERQGLRASAEHYVQFAAENCASDVVER